jgi:solute carrier family 45 protein 1/2/4
VQIVGFWILDLANNTVQGPCRALLVDVAHSDQQNLGGSFFSFMLGRHSLINSYYKGLGNLAGYLTGSQNLISVFPFFGTNVRALFTIGMCTLFICISITLLTVKETPVTKEEVEAAGKVENPFVEIFKGVVYMPTAMRRVCLVQFFTW